MIQVQTRNPKFVCVSSQVVNNTPSIHTEEKNIQWVIFSILIKKTFLKTQTRDEKVILYYKHLEV